MNARSVPASRSTWYCSGLSSVRHSASVFEISVAMMKKGMTSAVRFLAKPITAGRGRIPPASAPALDFHRSLPGYAPTPLHAAPDLARAWGVGEVWLKDETERLGLPAFKVMGASWAVPGRGAGVSADGSS